MTMLPVCSATPTCSSHSQISVHGGSHPFSSFQKELEARCMFEYWVFGLLNGINFQRDFFKTHATKSLYSNFVKGTEKSASGNFIIENSCHNELDYLKCEHSYAWSSSTGDAYRDHPMRSIELKYVENSDLSAIENGVVDLTDNLHENANVLSGNSQPVAIASVDLIPKPSTLVTPSVSLDVGADLLSGAKFGFEEFVAGASSTFNGSTSKGENVVKSTLQTINSSTSSIIKSAKDAVDAVVGKAFSTFDKTGELAGNRLTNFSSDLKEITSKAAVITVDVLRRTIVAVEDSLTKGTSFVIYSSKELLPPEIRDALDISEEKANQIFSLAKIAFQKVYITIEGFEEILGFDPNDPIIPFVLLIGTSVTLWVFYWVSTYSGYVGDLSPQSTLEILTGKENAVLIDIRPEVLRERDGIPDLRQSARYRYASVTIPEVNGSQRKLFKNGRDLENALTAAVVRNLKIVQDRSKVIVLDAIGSRSKGLARSLRKLAVKQPYLVQGGFRSWLKEDLRVKELKPETALTILNEDAEARGY